MTVNPSDSHTFILHGQTFSAESLAAGLYVTSTPIGNLADITVRALQVLGAADLILCEDTRVTRKLTRNYGIETPLRPYHDHNAEKVRPDIIARLSAGACIALVSDAGTPLISDPGFKLVRAAVEVGVHVTAIPGASAPLTALALAGLPSDKVLFAGFPPPKKGQRATFFNELRDVAATLVFFVSARKLEGVLSDIEVCLGDRPAVVARELTKFHEEVLRGRASELRRDIAARSSLKGEVTLLVAGRGEDEAADPAVLDAEIAAALEVSSVRDVAAELAAEHKLPRRQVYLRALEIARGETAGDTKDSE